ncbi:MAG: UDP-glucose 4-epimerase GalE [Mucispirillum sp.]|nr:UDP-glucose 4-epimerase GalE [Mucispirillum sp.]
MILVTGGAGYIGGTTARYLIEKGEQVVILDSLVSSNIEDVPNGAVFYKGDVADAALVTEIIKKHNIEACLHFAAYIEVAESCQNPYKYFENNTSKAFILFNTLKDNGVSKIVFSSTAAVYGEPEYIPIDENHSLNPVNPYGLSKYLVENMLSFFDVSYNVRFAALRYFNACGAWGGSGEKHNPETHLIPLILQVPLGKREKIYINGTDYDTKDGTCVRDYIHVYDLAHAHYLALNYLRAGGKSEKINLGTGLGFSIKEVIEVCEKVVGQKINKDVRERRAGDPAVLIASNEKAKEILGWDIKYKDLCDIVQSAYLFHKNN